MLGLRASLASLPVLCASKAATLRPRLQLLPLRSELSSASALRSRDWKASWREYATPGIPGTCLYGQYFSQSISYKQQSTGNGIIRQQLRCRTPASKSRHVTRQLSTAVSDSSSTATTKITTDSELPRISFYSSTKMRLVYADDLEDLSRKEPAFDKILRRERSRMEESADDKSAAATTTIPKKDVFWLDVTSVTPSEIKLLADGLGVHPLTMEDILAGETHEKLEMHRDYCFISYRSFDANPQSPTFLGSVNVYILSFAHVTLSLRLRPLLSATSMAKRLEERFQDKACISPDWINYEIIDEITDGFAPALKPIQAAVEELSETLVAGKNNPAALLKSIAAARGKVIALRRLLGSKLEVVKSLVKRHDPGAAQPRTELSLSYSDVQDHLKAVSEDLSHWEETLSQSENNCLIQLNLLMTQANNESSEAISKLTVLSTVLLPLNVITGLWGMNVTVPGQGVDSLHWFGGLAALLAIVASGGYFWATRFMRRTSRRWKEEENTTTGIGM